MLRKNKTKETLDDFSCTLKTELHKIIIIILQVLELSGKISIGHKLQNQYLSKVLKIRHTIDLWPLTLTKSDAAYTCLFIA